MSLAADQQRYSLRPISAVVAFSTLFMIALQAAPDTWQEAIRYDRIGVSHGQLWRILTSNFIHLDWNHLVLNLAGLWLGTWLFGADRSPRQWLMATACTALACGGGLWLFSPEVRWCVGLSGVLHGLMVVGFGGWALAGERSALLLLALVLGKMAWEQFGGEMPWAAQMAGGRVITDAHVWGAVGGAGYLGWVTMWKAGGARV